MKDSASSKGCLSRRPTSRAARLLCALLLTLCPASSLCAQAEAPAARAARYGDLQFLMDRIREDRAALERRYPSRAADRSRDRLLAFERDVRAELLRFEDADLSVDASIDRHVLLADAKRRIARLQAKGAKAVQLERWLSFEAPLRSLIEAREDMEPVVGRSAAATLTKTAEAMDALREEQQAEGAPLDPIQATRILDALQALRRSVEEWYRYHEGYDPLFTWWARVPMEGWREAADALIRAVRSAGGVEDRDRLVGVPIGEEALLAELAAEWIPYSPAELIAIAEQEMAWCDAEMAKAAKELGFDDWRSAQEHVKTLHVEPGEQPKLVRELAEEAIEWFLARDLLTVPPMAIETWRMTMLSPERQRISPFFLGGEVIQVAYPTDAMTHAEKLMSMRGNNEHFSRATVQHELIPGHHLQQFQQKRHRPWRRSLTTPFWVEGWALYWEMRLYELGFPRGPEDRIGMLFWRKHRCARILFSLGFHSGKLTPDECVAMLVDRVGHEPANASAEVRRSIGELYPPLYQAAYMLGGLQIRALHTELVNSGRMSERAFHDEILKQGSIPIELLRAALTGTLLPADARSRWRFYGE